MPMTIFYFFARNPALIPTDSDTTSDCVITEVTRPYLFDDTSDIVPMENSQQKENSADQTILNLPTKGQKNCLVVRLIVEL
jgi:hypothetical protein